MTINYQLLNFDINKIKFFEKEGVIDNIIVGDFSCINRNLFFLNENFLNELSTVKKNKILQLPLVIREDELDRFLKIIKKAGNFFQGFITGDLGIVKILNDLGYDNIIYTSNVINKVFSKYLKENYRIKYIRPLMYKRTFIEENVDFDKDIVVYGNFMLNCSTFCFHSGDLIENCKFECKIPKKLIMRKEFLYLTGRSLITENRLDIIDRINYIENIKSVTIQDLNLKQNEVDLILNKLKQHKENEN